MTYSFLLVNFNMSGLVARCIEQLKASVGRDEAHEILIADNSTDSRFAMPEETTQSNTAVRIVRIGENRGWVDAMNRLLPMASGRFVVIMHPDVTFEKGCFAQLRDFLEHHPGAGVVSPSLWYPDGTPNAIRLRFPKLSVELRRVANIIFYILFKRKPLHGEDLWDHQADVRADMVMSVMMMFRGETLSQIGAVDSKLWTYHANDWLCAKAGKLGWTCHYLAAARVIHWERHSPAGLYSNDPSSAYKRDPVPVSDRMCRDQFTFLRAIYSRPVCLGFRVIVSLEYLVHLLAQMKPGRKARIQTLRKHAATIKAAWAMERPQ